MAHDSELHDYEPLANPARKRIFAQSLPELEIPANVEGFSSSPNEDESARNLELESAAVERSRATSKTILKRGHAISFFGLLLFTTFVYFRPYELAGLEFLATGAKWIAVFTLLAFIPSQIAMGGNLTARPREVNLILLLALTALLSLPMAISIDEGWDHFTEYLKVVTMFIVMVNVVRTERRLNWMFWIALGVSLTTSIAAISDYQAGRLNLGGERIKGAIGGLFENPNDLALHLVTMIPLAVALFFARSGGIKKIIYGSLAVLMVVATICTFSRGGFLGLVAVAFALAWKMARKSRATVLVVALFAVLLFVAFAPAEYGGRLSSIWGGDATGSSNARQELFWRSLRVALRYPVFGVGIGNFHFRSIHEQVSHNAFTQVASELGMAAAVFYILFIVTPLKRLRRIERQTLGNKSSAKFYYLSVGLQASLIGYLVSSFFASVAFLWYVYYLVGYAYCMSRLYETMKVPTHQETATLTPGLLDQKVPKAEAL